MSKKILIPEPEDNLKFIDIHCHLPFPRPKNDQLPSDQEQYKNYFRLGGQYLITSTINIDTLNLTSSFIKEGYKNFGFTCGWAPQTVTYTTKDKYETEWNKWVDYILNHTDDFLSFGTIHKIIICLI